MRIAALLIIAIFATGPVTAHAARHSDCFGKQRHASDGLVRKGHRLRTRDGASLFFCEVRRRDARGNPLLLIHGGGAGSVATFDVDVPGYSLAADLANTGRPIILVNIRGSESSRLPSGTPVEGLAAPPAAQAEEAVADIARVADWARSHKGSEKVALLGFASGGHWAGLYAAGRPDKVERLASINALYAVKAPWPLRSAFADPNDSSRFNPNTGAFRVVDKDQLIANLRKWERQSGVEIDPRVVAEHQRIAFAHGNVGFDGKLRIPSGYMKDHFALAEGIGGWDASRLKIPLLVVRSEADHWSRPEDVEAIRRAAPDRVETVTIPGAGHFVMFNPADKGRAQLVEALLRFFAAGRTGPRIVR
jgi:pimeloyl-ACP methyl ester carboxylesterase